VGRLTSWPRGHEPCLQKGGGEGAETIQNVEVAGDPYGSEVTARAGRGGFVGTQNQDGTNAEQCADARKVYAGLIEGSRVQGTRAAWGRIHNRLWWPEAVVGRLRSKL
jgi:hypothetical protein